ncbi:hypothetical protein HYT91_01955 [Candidatus Pacearchaeota archaeon]|nr:hypothetical protein [Candidatus Pacearchaeota archaeon]
MPINYDKAQEIAMHYNIKIWTVFSVGIALSLWILYKIWIENSLDEIIKIAMLMLGYLVLIYCSLAVESFGQKKELYYRIKNEISRNARTEERLINLLPSCKTLQYWETIILSFIFFFYIASLIINGLSYPFIIGFISAFMSLGYLYVVENWRKGYHFRKRLGQNHLDPELRELFNNL